jgi:branched-chain amino acid transport system substrate-binding protein
MITSETGGASPEYTGIIPSAQARIDQINAAGGINGRKIKMISLDDTSSPTGNGSAAQRLIADGVFGIMDASAFAFGAVKVMNSAGIPVTGGAFDGPEWGTKPFTNMFAYTQPLDPKDPQYTTLVNFTKSLGGTKTASVGYGVSPSSSASATGWIFAGNYVGMTKGYLNTSLPFGSVDVTAIALSIKNSGADNLWMPLDENTNFAIINATKQAGAPLKVIISATGYGQALLDDKTAVQTAQGVYFLPAGQPVENNDPATTNFTGALKTYANYSGLPDFSWYTGWLSADLMIYGLQGAGQNPTRTTFMNYLHSVSKYTAGGMVPGANLTLAAFGTALPTACEWMTKLVGNQFQPENNGQLICGNLIPNSNQLP